MKTIVLLCLIGAGLEWLRRAVWVLQMRRYNPPLTTPSERAASGKVSVIIPARDEERNIARCLVPLFKQDHPDYEIIVVDDRSQDRTGALLENFKKLSPVPMRVVRVEKLPPDWTGKNHAMMVGAKAAAGEWLLFTDADTVHEGHSVSTAVETASARGIDLLTLAPRVECDSFWEHVVQPLAVSSLALWFDSPRLNRPGSKTVLANGQFILVKKKVYDAIGGNESVKSEVVEDVELAKKIHGAGYTVHFLNGTQLYATRMYSSLEQIKNGWTRIYIHLFAKKLLPILHKIFLFSFFSIAPFAVAACQGWWGVNESPLFDPTLFWTAVIVSVFIVALRAAGNARLRSNPVYAVLHPLGSLVMVWILCICVMRIVGNKPSVWRGDSHA